MGKYQFIVSTVDFSKKKTIVNISFYLNEYVTKAGYATVMMLITSAGKRKRLPLPFQVQVKYWDKAKKRLKKNAPEAQVINLILDQEEAKITQIRQQFYLQDKDLTLDRLIYEYQHNQAQVDFVEFMKEHLPKQKIKPGSYRKEESRIRKFEKFRPKLLFSEITLELIDEYIAYMANTCKNNENTIDSNLRTLKKYLNLAKKQKIHFDLEVSDIRTKTIKGNRTNLSLEEVLRLLDFYNSRYISEKLRLPLGYFLFCCYTGIRLNEVKKLTREDIGHTITFVSDKTGKMQTNPVPKMAREVVEAYPLLFTEWISDQRMNDYIREACRFVGIRKHVSFHTSRHTFSTNFLRCGGKVEELQKLLAHSDISTTMIYAHIVETEFIDVSILDSATRRQRLYRDE